MTCKERLNICKTEGTALLATNFYNFETLKGLLTAAQKMHSDLILQLSESTLRYLGIKPAIALATSMLEYHQVRGWIHLDHGNSLDIIKKCLEAGFDSVMIDASEKPLSENIKITKEVVKIAEHYNANVEAELGYIAKLGQEQSLEPTSAEEAKIFVDATGVNALAIAIGNAHGFYKKIPTLRFDRLEAIKNNTDCCLVLHGSSGIPDDQLQRAIALGICKINLATETKNAFMKKLQSLLKNSEEIDLRKVFPSAIESVEKLIIKKLQVVGTVNQGNFG